MDKSKKVLLATLPAEKKCRDWRAPDYYKTTKAAKYMPLGLMSLATNIDPHHQVVILDASAHNLTIDETIQRIEIEKPDILGLSVVTERAYAMKQILSNTSAPYKAVGGPHATHYADTILRQGADAVFVGNLADNEFSRAVNEEVRGKIECTTRINEIKFPRRDFVDVDFYVPKGEDFVFFKAQRRMPMFGSVGCPRGCIFCDVQSKSVQQKKPETVVDEMQYLTSLGCRSVHVLDDNFNISDKHLNNLLDELERRNLPIEEWSGRGEARLRNETAARLEKNHFRRIHVGFEGLDDGLLEYFKKAVRMKDINLFCETINRHNIDALGYFIVGTPVESQAYLDALPSRIKSLGIKYPYMQILYPAPNTAYYRQLLIHLFLL